MKTTTQLAKAAEEAVAYMKSQPGVREAEAFASANGQLICRLNYTSHLPCNGVQEPKSVSNFGLGVQVVLAWEGKTLVGFGQEAGDLTLEGIKRAFDKACRAAVADPEFHSLPRGLDAAPSLTHYHDPVLMELSEDQLVQLGWDSLDEALEVFSRQEDLCRDPTKLALVVGGDVTVLQERMAVFSTHMPKPLTDQSTLAISALSAMMESAQAKGSGWKVCSRRDDFGPEAGSEAARNSIAVRDGVRVEGGDYAAILGPQAVADLLNNVVIPSFSLGILYTGGSAFQGKLGRQVAAPSFSLVDDGANPNLAASKGITCEGLPTGRTQLIKDGVMVGTLANFYEYQRMLNSPRAAQLLGQAPKTCPQALEPRNGFRFAPGGGRSFSITPSISSTNVVVQGKDPVPLEELLKRVGQGLYIGRIWYTYPMNGLAPADFTSTVIGDSYVIEDGKLAKPIAANTLRIHDNVKRILMDIMGYSNRMKAITPWAADEVVYSPEVAVRSLHVEPIARFLAPS